MDQGPTLVHLSLWTSATVRSLAPISWTMSRRKTCWLPSCDQTVVYVSFPSKIMSMILPLVIWGQHIEQWVRNEEVAKRKVWLSKSKLKRCLPGGVDLSKQLHSPPELLDWINQRNCWIMKPPFDLHLSASVKTSNPPSCLLVTSRDCGENLLHQPGPVNSMSNFTKFSHWANTW